MIQWKFHVYDVTKSFVVPQNSFIKIILKTNIYKRMGSDSQTRHLSYT